jgi:hypothetical protein
MSGISAIIPNWNGGALVERVLEGLRTQTCPPEEIILVDNGSEDDSVEVARRKGAKVVALGRNAGFSGAVNRGIQESRREWLAIVNNDVEPARDWLEGLREAVEAPGAWFATGKLCNAAQRDSIDGTYDMLCRGGCAWRAGHGRRDGPMWAGGRKIGFAPFTAALFRAELFREVGLLDERFESYLEDVEFCLRCAIKGYEGVYAPEAVAYHVGSATLGPWHKETVRRISRNQLLLVAKHYPGRCLLQYGWPILVAQTLWGALALRKGAGLAFLRGKWEALRMAGRMRREAVWKAAEPRRLARILEHGEADILELQRQTGFDRYWRLYFALTSLV